ncbi:MAG: four-helix bundle copper-binding protein [Bacteroidota bacterium]|nr:four-helix bundle copper-binding protein [Bacteroidota bacterium]
MSHQKFQSCIDACVSCAVVCNDCATECLQENDIKTLAKCIHLDRECAAICFAVANLMSIGGEHAAHLLEECAEKGDACVVECENHPNLAHCKKCAEACRMCAKERRAMSLMAA